MEMRGLQVGPLIQDQRTEDVDDGKVKEYLDLWEADHDPTKAKKTYEELLSKVKDYARRRKLNTNPKEGMQQGGEPMDVGAVAGWDCDTRNTAQTLRRHRADVSTPPGLWLGQP